MPSDVALLTYFRALAADAAHGDSREESFYGSLRALLEQVAAGSGRTNAHVTTLPKKTDAGNPDFRVWDGQHHIVGYVEAKAPSVENLDAVEDSEQLERYLGTFPNLILTNFCEFRLYRNGERIARVLAARPYVLNKLGKAPPVERGDELLELLDRFFGFSLPKTFTAESLATELAKRTRFLRDIVAELLQEQVERKSGTLLGFYEAFDRYLLVDLGVQDFADLYAQTITYGLFAARTRAGKDFSRRTAFEHIPRTIGILRDVFQFVSLGDLPAQLEWIVDDIAEVLAVADAGEILDRFYREGKGSDPIVHFYETFLSVYDPAERERRGVYYTPEPVVGYIVRSLHKLLKTEFGRPDGLASPGVTLLDPAAGTMTFVARATEEAVHEFESKYGSGGRDEFIREHVLKNFYAFELMMAPYAIGHLKMGFYLEELGHKLGPDERFQLYLTNTLEMEELEHTNLPGMKSLAQESRLAGEVKKQTPILVILGNPPYSGHSSNKGAWIRELIEDYKHVDGKPLNERQPKWIQDDYVKFLRFGQWKIDEVGEGVIGMITNHRYLDNPTFRGMRRSLMRSFDEIRVLDLHGNSLQGEMPPQAGADDKNVFDIRQGVAISLFIKRTSDNANNSVNRIARVFHAEQWGLRAEKYDWLTANDLTTTEWDEIAPQSEFYLFVPRDRQVQDRYRHFQRVTDIFPESGVGMVTSRDDFVIDLDKHALERRMEVFRNANTSDEAIREMYKLRDASGWTLSEARREFHADHNWRDRLLPILYRPFDSRWIVYHKALITRPVFKTMRHLLRDNSALMTTRSTEIGAGFQHVFFASGLVQHHTVSLKEVNYIFPYYVYPGSPKDNRADQ